MKTSQCCASKLISNVTFRRLGNTLPKLLRRKFLELGQRIIELGVDAV